MIRHSIDNAANNTLSNLTENGKNLSNWSSNVTNCLTEIPQDIKLELNNGTLTLKTGSKLYIADGNFTEVTVTTDRTATSTTNGQKMIIATVNSNGVVDSLVCPSILGCVSGSDPASDTPSGKSIYFNTTDKKIYVNVNNVWEERTNRCMPLGTVTVKNGEISSIDQVFNGLGFIGKTVFVTKGVKGLIPDGRNSDGTLKNKEFIIDNLKIANMAANNIGKYFIRLSNNFIDFFPSVTYYDKNKNYIVYNNSNQSQMIAGCITVSNIDEIILTFSTKNVCHIPDYSEMSQNPDYSAGLNISPDILPYTIQQDGFINVCIYAQNNTNSLYINGYLVASVTSTNGTYYSNLTGQFKVSRGDIVRVFDKTKVQYFEFLPMIGV